MRAGSTRSNLPAETPPVMSRRSAEAALASAASMDLAVQPAFGKIQGEPPAAETMTASMARLELRIWLGPGEERMGTSSSPVERMATRGFRKTFNVAQPQEPASAICAEPIEEPAGRSLSPLRACAPRAGIF